MRVASLIFRSAFPASRFGDRRVATVPYIPPPARTRWSAVPLVKVEATRSVVTSSFSFPPGGLEPAFEPAVCCRVGRSRVGVSRALRDGHAFVKEVRCARTDPSRPPSPLSAIAGERHAQLPPHVSLLPPFVGRTASPRWRHPRVRGTTIRVPPLPVCLLSNPHRRTAHGLVLADRAGLRPLRPRPCRDAHVGHRPHVSRRLALRARGRRKHREGRQGDVRDALRPYGVPSQPAATRSPRLPPLRRNGRCAPAAGPRLCFRHRRDRAPRVLLSAKGTLNNLPGGFVQDLEPCGIVRRW